jgi:CIC family chloride channel protein
MVLERATSWHYTAGNVETTDKLNMSDRDENAVREPAGSADRLNGALEWLGARLRSGPISLRRWFQSHLPSEAQHLLGLTVLVGVVCGVTAVAFHLAIRAAEDLLINRALSAPGLSWMVWTVVTPTLAGLLAGACLTWIVPGARGSGVPQVKVAYATEGGRVRFRDAVGKFFISTLQIGAGASLGREGPTVQICAGATSLLARLTALPPRNMRRLTPVGVAAGIAAAFNAPIAAVTFTIEEIVGALDNTVLSGVVVAAAIAAMIERSVLGVHPVIQVHQSYGLEHASSLLTYLLLGIAAAPASVLFTESLLGLRLWFRRLRAIPSWTHPAIGGLVTGILAVLVVNELHVTGVTGGGYETLGLALAGELGLRALLVLCVIKLIATVFSYSSGGAGGIFAPALFVGAMLGGVFGHVDILLFGQRHEQLGAFALVGMGAVFAGVIRAPITSVLIIVEMTGSYGLVLPLMIANMTSYGLARRWRPVPVYEALLAQDGIQLPHASPRVHPLEQLSVANAMTAPSRRLSPRQSLVEAARGFAGETFTLAPVTDARGVVLGGVLLSELRDAATRTPQESVESVLEPVHSIAPDARLVQAVVRMTELGVRQLVVVEGAGVLVGIVAMSDVVRAHGRAAPTSIPPPTSAATPSPARSAASLMTTVVLVESSGKLSELAIQDDEARNFLVRLADGYRVMLEADIQAWSREAELDGLVTVADLARPAPVVAPTASLSEIARVLGQARAEAVVVESLDDPGPLGIVTRTALANALLDWFTAKALPFDTNHNDQA